MTDEQQAALAAKDARIAELEAIEQTELAKVVGLAIELRALKAELAGWREEAERSHRNVAYWQGRAEQAEAELATLRGALELAERDEDGRCNVCGHETMHWARCQVGNALATPPRRTPEGDDALDDAARNLFAALCEGDGKHSEALDRRIIASHLDAYARRTTPPRRPPEPECDSCGERHLPQVMCPPHEVRRGTRNTMAVKPQGDDT
jgi:hypothetical protein